LWLEPPFRDTKYLRILSYFLLLLHHLHQFVLFKANVSMITIAKEKMWCRDICSTFSRLPHLGVRNERQRKPEKACLFSYSVRTRMIMILQKGKGERTGPDRAVRAAGLAMHLKEQTAEIKTLEDSTCKRVDASPNIHKSSPSFHTQLHFPIDSCTFKTSTADRQLPGTMEALQQDRDWTHPEAAGR
jgi:hypothetical protein